MRKLSVQGLAFMQQSLMAGGAGFIAWVGMDRSEALSPTKDIGQGCKSIWSGKPEEASALFQAAKEKCPNNKCRETVDEMIKATAKFTHSP